MFHFGSHLNSVHYFGALAGLAGLLLSACDHAKDLIEQGKKQTEEIQRSIEGKSETAAAGGPADSASSATAPAFPAASSPSGVSSPAAAPAAVSPAQTAPPTVPQPAPAAADPHLLVESFLSGDAKTRTDMMLHSLAALPEEYRAQITKCDLTDGQISDEGLAELAKFPNLTLVNLTGIGSITGRGLALLKNLKLLEVLVLERCYVGDAEVNYLRGLTNLKVLNLEKTKVTDAGIGQLGTLSHLEELHVSFTTINGSSLRTVPWGGSLRVLMANGTTVGENLDFVKRFRGLEELGLYQAGVSDRNVGILKGFSKLRKLYLGGNGLSDLGVKQLTGLTGIEDLSLGKNPITDKCLSTFKACQRLKHFGEGETGITAAGREYIRKIAPDCTFDVK